MRYPIPKVPRSDASPQYHFDDEVSLRFYRLQKISEDRIVLQTDGRVRLVGPTEVCKAVVAEERSSSERSSRS